MKSKLIVGNKLNDMRKIIVLFMGILVSVVLQAQTPQIWQDYVHDKQNGVIPELNDYSYAGYHFSEEEIPSVDSWTQFNVLDFGAIANDDQFDDDAIQLAIDAAEAHNGPAVVFFPAGRFMISDNNSTNEFIRISRDSIVLKGSGSGADGTEIFMKEMRVRNGHWQFLFQPNDMSTDAESVIAAPVVVGSHDVIVDDASGFEVGEVVLLSHQSQAFAEAHFGDLPLSSQWTRLFGSGGMNLHELHEIKAITGTRLTFVNPVQTVMPLLEEPYIVSHYSTMQEVGVEDILFTSDWAAYPEEFVHHKDDIHDYAWNAMQFNHVRNGWVRNCELSSWNQGIDVRESIGFTISDVTITGKKGHASFLTRRSYGLLVKDCQDPAGQHHGPGTGYAGVNTVYLRHSMVEDVSIDSHSGQPYATLMDDVDGGTMSQNGGPHESYPHHGQDFTFWNFRHKSTSDKTYNFWSIPRNGNTYAYPNFIGFQPNNAVTFDNEGMNQMEGQMVSPRSLFEAQLELRLADSRPEIRWISPGYGLQVPKNGNVEVEVDVIDDGSVTNVTLYVNGVKQNELTSLPYRWGQDQALDPDLFDLVPGTYELSIEATDNEGNVATDAINVYVGQAPIVDFERPGNNDVVESGVPLIVEASANDPDGTVTAVSLFLDGVLVSTKETAPYIWQNESDLASLQSGQYTLRLEARDNDDLLSQVTYNLTANDFPELNFTTPKQGDLFDFGDTVKVEVAATDGDGEIKEVRLYLNGTFIRTEFTPPYAWGEREVFDPALFTIADGTYELEAVAKDDLGSESSSRISFIVNEEVALSLEQPAPQIEFFPNPFDQRLVITSEVRINEVKIFDSSGALLETRISTRNQGTVELSTSHLTAGIYFVHVLDGQGAKRKIKVIKR